MWPAAVNGPSRPVRQVKGRKWRRTKRSGKGALMISSCAQVGPIARGAKARLFAHEFEATRAMAARRRSGRIADVEPVVLGHSSRKS